MSNSSLVTYTRITKNKTSPRNHAIDTISIHCIVGQWTAKQGCDYFATTDRECSSNYVVGKDGSIGLSVEEKDRSWCTSSRANDNRAITIETASDTTHPYAVTDAAYEALIKLVADICKRNGKNKIIWFADKEKSLAYEPKPNEMIMTVHRWFSNTACPGEYLYTHHGEIAQRVNEILNEVEYKMYVKIDVKDREQADKLVQLLKNAEIVEVQPEVKVEDTTAIPKKTIEELAREVWNGKWGNGQERKDRLTAAGHDYKAVQAKVNELFG